MKPQRTEAHENYKKLLEVLKLGRLAGAMLGQQLWKLKANNDYQKAVGEGIDTWVDFLKMPEVNLQVREANRAMEIYEEFCIKRNYSVEMLAEVGTKNLHYLLPAVKKGELGEDEISDLVESGKNLPQKSFKERFYDVKSKGGDRHYEFVLMKKCVETGNLQRVQDITHEDILHAFNTVGRDLSEMIIPEVI